MGSGQGSKGDHDAPPPRPYPEFLTESCACQAPSELKTALQGNTIATLQTDPKVNSLSSSCLEQVHCSWADVVATEKILMAEALMTQVQSPTPA